MIDSRVSNPVRPDTMTTSHDAPDAPAEHVPPIRRALADLAGLSPAYFGMVMATGIVSLAAHLLAWPSIARALFQLNVVVYVVLWLLTVLRAIRFPRSSEPGGRSRRALPPML